MNFKYCLANPDIGEEEIKEVTDVLRSKWLGEGEKTKQLEKDICKYLGVENAVACFNGTVALHLILLAFDIKEGDEVIVPPVTFISTVNSICFTGATPVFADIKPDTFNIDPEQIEKHITPKTKAVMVVHYGGQPAQMDEISAICKKHNLYLLEDSAEALGAEYKGKKAGSLSDAAIFSFTITKNITMGEGGIITTPYKEIADKIRALKNHGQTETYNYHFLGYNYRTTDIQSAIGIVQMKKLDAIIERKRANAKFLKEIFKENPNFKVPYEDTDCKHTYMIYTLTLNDKLKDYRDKIMNDLHNEGVQARLYFPPAHLQPYYKQRNFCNYSLPVTEEITKKIISLPFNPSLNKEDITEMSQIFIKTVSKYA